MSEAKPLIFEKICAIMAEMDAVPKGNTMTQGSGYKYRSIDQIKNASNPLFAKHGVFYSPKVLEHKVETRQSKSGGQMLHHTIKVLYTAYAQDGSKVESEVYGEAMDSGDKGLGKAQTYAEKVMLIQVLNIPTEEQLDPDHERPDLGREKPPQATLPPAAAKPKEDPKIISAAQLTRLMAIAGSAGWKEDEVKNFLKSKGYNSRKDILKKDYEAICKQIEFPDDPSKLEDIPF